MVGLVDGNNFYVSCERVFDRRLLGRPVAVLSNNDGCCVAMSPEFKALGIPRGTPYFKLRYREKSDGLIFRSSNYELYGDLSRRILSILREESADVEQYSIDEAFVFPPSAAEGDLYGYGRHLREKILRWVGIPCGVGFAPSKTLAKIANHIGKKRSGGVFVMPEDPTEILAQLPVEEVWGVGRRLCSKLRAERIMTAKDLRDASTDIVRSVGGVTLQRTAMELRGNNCSFEREEGESPDSVSCSRCFGEQVTNREDMHEAIATFAATAAAKLRRHHMLASGCNVYVQASQAGLFDSPEAEAASFDGRTVIFDAPTDATTEMLSAMTDAVDALFVQGNRYRKAGVVFFGLEEAGSIRQMDLFTVTRASESSKLFQAIDSLNARLGDGYVRVASQGLPREKKSWMMKRDRISHKYTTSWKELPKVY